MFRICGIFFIHNRFQLLKQVPTLLPNFHRMKKSTVAINKPSTLHHCCQYLQPFFVISINKPVPYPLPVNPNVKHVASSPTLSDTIIPSTRPCKHIILKKITPRNYINCLAFIQYTLSLCNAGFIDIDTSIKYSAYAKIQIPTPQNLAKLHCVKHFVVKQFQIYNSPTTYIILELLISCDRIPKYFLSVNNGIFAYS